MRGRFGDKVAVVSGAGSGIGRAVARRLASEGAAVGLIDVDAEGLAVTAADLGDASHRVATANVADPDGIARAIDDCASSLGGIDIVATAAGIFRTGSLLTLAVSDFEQQFAVNVTGTFLTVQAAARHLVDQGRGGRVVCIASEAALVTAERVWAYSAGKAAIDLMVRGWAQELGPHQVTVNTVAPGLIDTPLASRQAGQPDGPLRRAAADGRAVRRIGTPDEIAGLVAFLASDEAAYVTGAFLLADGGARDRHAGAVPDPAARDEYREVAAEWSANDRRQRALLGEIPEAPAVGSPIGGDDAG